MINLSKQIIYGDGIDAATVQFSALSENQEISFSINGTPHTALADIPTTWSQLWYARVDITCDTPNQTIIVEQGTERAVIYSVGAP